MQVNKTSKIKINMIYQSFLKDCDCGLGGIIFHIENGQNIAVCRWCRKPYAKGGNLSYEEEHFKSSTIDYKILFYKNINTGNVVEASLFHPAWIVLYKIQSVLRLSDGEIFAIKDETNFGTIKSFYVNDYGAWAAFEETCHD